MGNNKYIAYKSGSNGVSAQYSIKDKNGNKSAFAFDTKEEAESHLRERLEYNQDPLGISTDWAAMSKALLDK